MLKASRAFTLIEIMVVVVIVGIMATLILPRLTRRPPSSEWPIVLDDLNNLIYFARQEAISHQKLHRLYFQKKGKEGTTVTVQVEKQDPEHPEKNLFEAVDSGYFSTTYKLSEFIQIDNIFHGKHDEWAEGNGKASCYVVPNGLVQDVLIRLTRNYDGEASKVSFRMKPFLGKFDLVQGHIRPEK